MFDKLVAKINPLNTCKFVLKTQYNTDKSSLEKEIDDTGMKTLDTTWYSDH